MGAAVPYVNFVALLSRFSKNLVQAELICREDNEIPCVMKYVKKLLTKQNIRYYISVYLIQTKFTSVCVKEIKNRMNDASENRFCSGMKMGNKVTLHIKGKQNRKKFLKN